MGFQKEMGMVPELSLFLRQIYCITKFEQPFRCLHLTERESRRTVGKLVKVCLAPASSYQLRTGSYT